MRVGLTLSAAFAVLALSIQVIRTLSYGRKPLYAKPQGKPWYGVLYAFGLGMMPWEKESTGKHLPTFVAGTIYHLAILSALVLLVLQTISPAVFDDPFLPLAPLFLAGAGSGAALLARRALKPHLRQISSPDDFIANLLVDLFLITAFLVSMSAAYEALFLTAAIILFLYMPLGKIRHCVFFFYSRVLFGTFFGSRGVLPHQANGARQ